MLEAYTVLIECEDEDVFAEIIDWLRQSHIDEVLAAGAMRADLVIFSETLSAQVRYVFGSEHEYQRYIKDDAPRLRQEGMSRFGPERGVRMSRTEGKLIPFERKSQEGNVR